MNILTSKKAAKIIDSFTFREKTTHLYLLDLYKNTIEKIEGCTKEINVFGNNKPIYRETNKAMLEAEFRLKYIWQCLQLHVNYDYERKVFEIRSDIYEDKDNKPLNN